MNPYASFLGGRDPRAVIGETSGKLAGHVGRLGSAGIRRNPAPGKWSAAEVICHLADCEMVFAFRLRQALAEPHHTIQPFEQEAWGQQYGRADECTAMELFSATRRWNVGLIDRMTPDDLAKQLTHPERGEMTVRTVVETMAGHDLNHLEQLERIR